MTILGTGRSSSEMPVERGNKSNFQTSYYPHSPCSSPLWRDRALKIDVWKASRVSTLVWLRLMLACFRVMVIRGENGWWTVKVAAWRQSKKRQERKTNLFRKQNWRCEGTTGLQTSSWESLPRFMAVQKTRQKREILEWWGDLLWHSPRIDATYRPNAKLFWLENIRRCVLVYIPLKKYVQGSGSYPIPAIRRTVFCFSTSSPFLGGFSQ